MKTSLPANKRLAQPHHAYNVFFTLERLRLIDKKTPVDATSGKVEQQTPSQSYDLDGYESLVLPDIPPRYQHLQLPTGWFVPGKNSNRKHTKSNERELDVNMIRVVCYSCLMRATIISLRVLNRTFIFILQPQHCPSLNWHEPLRQIIRPSIRKPKSFAKQCPS